jgi:uncharacterized protein with PIN domain
MWAGESISKVLMIQERNTLKNNPSVCLKCSQQLLRLSGDNSAARSPAEIQEMDLNKLANNMSDL